MRLDNQLFRVAENALHNGERLRAWRIRYEEYQRKQPTQNRVAEKEKENVSKTNT
jgi:hypothetical protein